MSSSAFSDIKPISLIGRHVQLVPLSQAHRDGLVAAVRDGELWRLWYTAAPTPEAMEAEIDRRLGRLGAGNMVPFTVLDMPKGRVAGMTTFMNIDAIYRRVENGTLRDTCVYSVIQSEWPAVRSHLLWQLEKPR